MDLCVYGIVMDLCVLWYCYGCVCVMVLLWIGVFMVLVIYKCHQNSTNSSTRHIRK